VHTFRTYDELVDDLAQRDAIKIGTWWATAEHVLRAVRERGTAVYYVQDFETSYYPRDPRMQRAVLASYRSEFAYFTESSWVRDRLAELGVDATLVPPGIDLATYRPTEVERRRDVLLTVGRAHHLKNLPLTWLGWRRLPRPRPEFWMFGNEPELAKKYDSRYFTTPSDEQVNELLNQATVFVLTSRHEGFGLPLLEAMAAGTAVVCTDGHGNRDFCRDGVNCLMPEARSDALAAALARLFADANLRGELAADGLRTAAEYDWERRIDALEHFLESLASGARVPASASGRA
jgi:glycosyltransferase involved in cell wall biosynthesis